MYTTDYKSMVTPTGLCLLPKHDLIDLLEFKLQCLEKAFEEDSSWNYGIDELKAEIEFIKNMPE